MRDPCVLPDNGTYYLVGTQPPYRNGVNDGENVERVFFLPVTYLNDGNVKIETD